MGSHREKRFTRSALRLPGAIAALSWLAVRRALARSWQRLLFARPSGDETRVLVFRLGSIGDHLAARPALEAIRRRHGGAHMRLLTNAGPATSWPAQLGMSLEAVAYQSVPELRRLVQEFAPEVMYYLPPYPLSLRRSLRDASFFRACGIKKATGFCGPDATGWVARALRPWRQCPREWSRVAAACGVDASPSLLQPGTGPAMPGRTIAMIPGGKSTVQHWPMDRYRTVAAHVRGLGFTVAWFGGPEDCSRVDAVAAAEDLNFAGKLTLAEAMSALGRCQAAVSNDTGLAHAAAALGVPLVIVSSARSAKGAWEPAAVGDKVRVLRSDVACESCELRECASLVCLTLIEPAVVLSALQELGVFAS